MKSIDSGHKMLQPPALFLSGKGAEKVRAVADVLASSLHPPKALLDEARSCLFRSDWKDFDQTYLALYVVSRLKDRELRNTALREVNAFKEDGVDKKLTVLFDTEFLGDIEPHRLLDEAAVASLISFRSALQGAIPFPSAVSYLHFGCFILELTVRLPSMQTLRQHGSEFAEFSHGEWVDLFLEKKNFRALFERYSAEMEVS